jgi:drug/metabolite transporter (DMT)-like permease
MQAMSYSPYICLLVIVGLLGTVTPVIKSVFVATQVDPVSVAALRTLVAFVILFPVAACRDLRAVMNLSRRDVVELSVLGSLGLGSYLVAATGLNYTTVTHYVLLYSLLPAWTALFMALLRYRRLTAPVLAGMGLSMLGCALAVTVNSAHELDITLLAGDGLVLLFTIMMALYLVASRNITSRIGTLPANAVMFGSTAFLMIAVAWTCATPPAAEFSGPTLMALAYIGAATAVVFLLRAHALKILPPTTVASFHNLVPVCTLVVANVWLGEPLRNTTLFGAAIILCGLEVLRRTDMNPRVNTETTSESTDTQQFANTVLQPSPDS